MPAGNVQTGSGASNIHKDASMYQLVVAAKATEVNEVKVVVPVA